MLNLLVGRHPDCDVVVEDPTVSRRHAELSEVAAGLYLLNDTGSTCGTFLMQDRSWKRISSVRVRTADRIRLGAFEATVGEVLALAKAGANRQGGIVERDPETGEIVVRSR